jgi:hypothetical protein
VEADTSQWAQIAERFGDIQREQKIHGCFEIQAAKLVGSLAVPDLAGLRISPRPDHGIKILRYTVNDKVASRFDRPVSDLAARRFIPG